MTQPSSPPSPGLSIWAMLRTLWELHVNIQHRGGFCGCQGIWWRVRAALRLYEGSRFTAAPYNDSHPCRDLLRNARADLDFYADHGHQNGAPADHDSVAQPTGDLTADLQALAKR